MEAHAPTQNEVLTDDAIERESAARPLVYVVVAIGVLTSVVSVLIASDGVGFATMATTLVAVLPYLVFARLAILQPGADAVVAGIMLLTAGTWGALSYFNADLGAFVQLAAYLLGLVLVVFGVGAFLRHLGTDPQPAAVPAPPRTRRERTEQRRSR